MKGKLAVIVLTKNEQVHIARAIASIQSIADEILVVDSGSVDDTVMIAERLGANVIFHPWVNYASQFNYALTQVSADIEWIFRLDADEIVDGRLLSSIDQFLSLDSNSYQGAYVQRSMTFMEQKINWGGVFPVEVLRIFRKGSGYCEKRWMDEHIVCRGDITKLDGELLDNNLNSLSWWIEKHNSYASREAVDILSRDLGLGYHSRPSDLDYFSQAYIKRLFKEYIYLALPLGFRAVFYFVYRYIFRLGFLDGFNGFLFHFFQGFWYRFLVDCKVREIRRTMKLDNLSFSEAVINRFGFSIDF